MLNWENTVTSRLEFKKIPAIFLAILLLCFSVFAQTEKGTLQGNVKDIADAVIVGATVTVVGQDGRERTAQTDDSGSFIFEDLPVGDYTVRAVNEGFSLYENPEVEVVPDRLVALNITLNVEAIETEVRVGDETKLDTSPEGGAGALIIKGEEIEALPDDEEDLEAALQALAGPSAGPNGGGIYIDGFSGGSLPPRDTIREIRINSNPFSSEFDRLGSGRIEILTKPGTDRFRGSAEFEFEDEALNSRNPFVADRPSFQKREFEARLSGPIIKNRASFFLNFENEDTDNNALVNALVLDDNLNPTPLQFSAAAPSREIEFNPRLDFQIDEKNTLVVRYGFERDKRENAGLGGFNLLSRAFDRKQTEHALRVTETAVLNPKTINETRFQYIRQRESEESEDDSPTIRVLDAFTGGGANTGLTFSEDDRIELQNYTSLLFKKHSLKVGARLRHFRLLDSSPGNFAGTFTFTSIEQYRGAILGTDIPTQFSIAGGDPEAGVSQTDVGLFLQDDWRVNPELTLSFGLRYENQTNISSKYNFAPRFGFAYAPGAGGQNEPKTVFRGGFGIFYDRFGEGLTLQARRFNGTNQQRFVVDDPAILGNVIFTQNGVSNVPTVDQLSAFAQPQTTRIVSPDLQTPYTAQFAFSVERKLPFNTTFSATYINARTNRLLRSRNINAPIDGVRPFPDQGNIFQYESTGEFRQNQLILNLRTRFQNFSLFGNYSLNKAESDTDGAGTFPADQYDLTGEFGRAGLDVRHRFVIGGSYNAPWGFRFRPFIIFRSGAPFNITNGVDSNGDSLFTERPTFAQLATRCSELNLSAGFCDASGVSDLDQVIPRNYGSGPEFFIVNLRMSKAFGFGTRSGGDSSGNGRGGGRGGRFGGPFGGGRGSGGGGNDKQDRFTLEFTVQIRNLFNRNNLSTPVGNLRSPFFGQSLSTAGGFGFGGGGSSAGNRRIELEIQFEF
ncbi:MAG: carboxypeptidase regulatory-like domain-containing protein [Pyrinomonadaceae bacterium]